MSFFDGAKDWNLNVNLNKHVKIQKDVLQTSLRPDLVLTSIKTKILRMMELSVSCENRIEIRGEEKILLTQVSAKARRYHFSQRRLDPGASQESHWETTSETLGSQEQREQNIYSKWEILLKVPAMPSGSGVTLGSRVGKKITRRERV